MVLGEATERDVTMRQFMDGLALGMGWGTAASMLLAVISLAPYALR
jgi:hypothetical protein